uniref:EF-hand domain-containing protein n=1 Tax=Globisporangium ultimum (strain ATCC 200006 / CBS 805.95 / DAOM BR144) TaxID=431595 RepID=K3X041_GLOUD
MQQTDLLEDIRRAFKAMDLRAQGFITLESFETACALVLPRISKQILLGAFHEADRDGDG